jgi:hypothetical protein
METSHCSGLHINTKMVLERQYAQPSCQILEVFLKWLNPCLNSSHGYKIKNLLNMTMARSLHVQGTNHAHLLK